MILQVLTKDSVTVAVDAVVYYRIYNPIVAVTNVEDADRSTRLLAATTLRNVLGTKSLSEILSERESISASMQVFLASLSNHTSFLLPLDGIQFCVNYLLSCKALQA